MITIAGIYRGYVTIPRDVQTLPLWDNPHDTTLWLYCLLHASHQPFRDLVPGQFYASQKKIAEELHWSRKTIRTCLTRLEQKGMLRVSTSDRGTIITVSYWQEISSGRGLLGGNVYATGEDETIYTWQTEQKPAQTEDAENAGKFDTFWQLYPRKSDKAEARRLFMSMSDDADRIIEATEKAKNQPEWYTENGRYVPSPLKWLDGRWEQYAPPPTSSVDDDDEEWTSW